MKKLIALLMALSIATVGFTGCAKQEAPAKDEPTKEAATEEKAEDTGDKVVVGFAQIGQESGWRDAETASIQSYAEEHSDTIELIFSDGQQKQENQIKAIKSFIEMEVDVIGIAPVVTTGWDAVFTEAKDAGIPIILMDRTADVSEDLFVSYIGPDVVLEGTNAALEMADLLEDKGNIVILEGTVGASAATERQVGFMAELENHPDINVLASQTGDFTRAKGKEVMESFLKTYGDEIDGVYAHNDDMMLGAIEAMKEAGYKPAEDIKTVSVDGVMGIFEAMVAGEANVTIECNPVLGPQFFEAAQMLKDGKEIESWIKSDEGIYRQATAADDIGTRTY